MKPSNLHFGFTTGLLALASFAFTKSLVKGSIPTARCRTAPHPSPIECIQLIKKVGLLTVPSLIKEACINGPHTGTLVTTIHCAVTLIESAD
jgi:hypothetical protein